MTKEFAITLAWRRGYEFSVDFGQNGVGQLLTDEPPPLGEGAGPNPARLLAAAVGNCMSASLKYCMDGAKIDLEGLTTTVEGTIVRNEQGRLRIGSLRVRLAPSVDPDDLHRIGHCLEVFEDFCIVGQSVRRGIDITVDVSPSAALCAAGGNPLDH
jgi:organic hydroperoxide reductase OsmC/OhrA